MINFRKIDALIAEHVMKVDKEEWWFHSCWLPKYSADISAAWEVVEKIRTQLGKEVIQPEWDEYRNALQYLCHMSPDKAALEICLAALKAKGVECGSIEKDKA